MLVLELALLPRTRCALSRDQNAKHTQSGADRNFERACSVLTLSAVLYCTQGSRSGSFHLEKLLLTISALLQALLSCARTLFVLAPRATFIQRFVHGRLQRSEDELA